MFLVACVQPSQAKANSKYSTVLLHSHTVTRWASRYEELVMVEVVRIFGGRVIPYSELVKCVPCFTVGAKGLAS